MLNLLLAQADVAASPDVKQQIDQIYNQVVRHMPYGGLGLIFLLIALTLIVALWVAWSQRTLARNQVRMAKLIEAHLAAHQQKK